MADNLVIYSRKRAVMMKNTLLITTLLLLYAVALGQTDDPGCYFMTSLQDNSCGTGQPTCTSPNGCVTQTFHVQCTGLVRVKAWTSCTGSDCSDCASCVRIIAADGSGTVYYTLSTLAECRRDMCCSLGSISLQEGDYILAVCLYTCTDGGSCCTGGSGCSAWGTVSSDSLVCP